MASILAFNPGQQFPLPQTSGCAGNCRCLDQCNCELATNIFDQMDEKIVKLLDFEKNNLKDIFRYEYKNGELKISIKFKNPKSGAHHKIKSCCQSGKSQANKRKLVDNGHSSGLECSTCETPSPQISPDITPRISSDLDFQETQPKLILEPPTNVITSKQPNKFRCQYCFKVYTYLSSFNSHIEECKFKHEKANKLIKPIEDEDIIDVEDLGYDQGVSSAEDSSQNLTILYEVASDASPNATNSSLIPNPHPASSNAKNPPSSAEPKDKNSLQCPICQKTFKYKHHLKRHKDQVHSQARPFKCNFCDQTFKDKYNLKVHERIHTGYKPYKCHICDKSFNQKGTLNVHLKTHKGQEKMKKEEIEGMEVKRLKMDGVDMESAWGIKERKIGKFSISPKIDISMSFVLLFTSFSIPKISLETSNPMLNGLDLTRLSTENPTLALKLLSDLSNQNHKTQFTTLAPTLLAPLTTQNSAPNVHSHHHSNEPCQDPNHKVYLCDETVDYQPCTDEFKNKEELQKHRMEKHQTNQFDMFDVSFKQNVHNECCSFGTACKSSCCDCSNKLGF